MRLVSSCAVFLLISSSLSPALAQTTPVEAKAPASDSGEASDAPQVPDEVDEDSDGVEGGADEAASEEALPPEGAGEEEESVEPAKSEPASSEKGAEADKVKVKVTPKVTETEEETEAEEEPEGEVESGSPDEETHEAAAVAPGEPEASSPGSAESAKVGQERLGFVFAPRLGLTVGGATHLGSECEETGNLGCGTFGIRDHKEASGFGVAADALYGLIPELRLGASLMWLPQAKGDAGGELRRLGTEVHLQAVAEGVFDLMDRLAVTVRVQGGGAVLAPGGFVDDVVKEAQDDCELARDAGVDCTVHDGPYFAPVFGGGAGILVQTKRAARLRLDFLFETKTLPIYEQKAASDSGTVNATVTMDQSRFWLLGGFEI